MKEVEVAPKFKVLVYRTDDGEFAATSTKCTHYGAPLIKGVLEGDRVVCPWHAACFNVKSGDIEDAPALDGLHTFPVSTTNGRVVVTVPPSAPANHKRTQAMCAAAASPSSHAIIIGAGAAGAIAAETLRQEGWDGSITMIGNEPDLPYDRIKLSKNLNVQGSAIHLRSQAFYDKHNITVKLGTTVTGVDKQKKTVTTDQGETLSYTKLLIATGGNARRIPCEGHDLEGVHVLRVVSDAQGINADCEGAQSAVIIGSSFIGMEAAAALITQKKIKTVTVVGMESVPFERVLGADIGATMQALAESKGVQFRMKAMLKRYVGKNGKVTGVELESGEVLPADLVVVGAGIICATGFLEGTLTRERDGSIIVDEHLQAEKDIYVAGDIARFPYWDTGALIRIEHWDVAQQHGRVAARNMCGIPTPYASVPFFWTAQFGKNLRYAGNAMQWDDIIYKGDLDAHQFVAYFVHNKRVIAVATLGADPVAVKAAEMLRTNSFPSVTSLRRESDPHYLLKVSNL
eukprot:TRINITY_DN1542_c0_g1_i2.p1 TRINITY_DN1542_c0_g1~~TRINITY_DN1542_c0_g1_i2.p1  ORF type:complete len:516 (-),score=192.07 TRINITY_DN1542_c0_g1_i2:110-1657(-)